ncbi:hypothetical protein [Formosa haliotis]|uniref:hypothetical protein n=1 Tax=Formosa haliotis TaxID=1555194 RepID=UPI0008265B43|nr:hypothetical protein [Formosa haliotis]
MTKQNIKIIKNSFLLGMAYAIGMAAFDYFNSANFSTWKFLFHFSFFGIAMGLVNRSNLKEKSNEK